MHPVSHAKSSAARHGGPWRAYLPIHAFLDGSKACSATAQHRIMLHSADFGLHLVTRRFGPALVMQERTVDIEGLFLQHLDEDLALRAPLDRWLEGLATDAFLATPGDCLPERLRPFRQDPLSAACHAWGGTPAVYKPVLDLLKAPSRFSAHSCADAIMQNSFGIFTVEACIGPEIQVQTGRTIPTRFVAERFVEALSGEIRSAASVIEAIALQDWMLGPWERGPGPA